MGRNSVTESGRGMNPDAPPRMGVPAVRRYWVGGRSGFTAESAGTAECRRKRQDLPCDGSVFTAPLRFILLEGANAGFNGVESILFTFEFRSRREAKVRPNHKQFRRGAIRSLGQSQD